MGDGRVLCFSFDFVVACRCPSSFAKRSGGEKWRHSQNHHAGDRHYSLCSRPWGDARCLGRSPSSLQWRHQWSRSVPLSGRDWQTASTNWRRDWWINPEPAGWAWTFRSPRTSGSSTSLEGDSKSGYDPPSFLSWTSESWVGTVTFIYSGGDPKGWRHLLFLPNEQIQQQDSTQQTQAVASKMARASIGRSPRGQFKCLLVLQGTADQMQLRTRSTCQHHGANRSLNLERCHWRCGEGCSTWLDFEWFECWSPTWWACTWCQLAPAGRESIRSSCSCPWHAWTSVASGSSGINGFFWPAPCAISWVDCFSSRWRRCGVCAGFKFAVPKTQCWNYAFHCRGRWWRCGFEIVVSYGKSPRNGQASRTQKVSTYWSQWIRRRSCWRCECPHFGRWHPCSSLSSW